MNASIKISRRAFAGGLALLGLDRGFGARAGFCRDSARTRKVSPPWCPAGALRFPPTMARIRNFASSGGTSRRISGMPAALAYGAQWTLFRQATRSGAQQQGWANQQIWMGHAAVTSADTHRYGEAFARGGVGQAGVETRPFLAWIDSWEMRGRRWRCATPCWRRSTSRRRAPIFPTRCGSTPTGRWCCRATPATAANRNADRPRIITASRFSRRAAASASATSPSRSLALPGWTGSGAASRLARIRPDGTGSRCI